MLQQVGGALTPWPATAVHDTMAAIVRQMAYRRSIRTSVLDRVFSWLFDLLDRFAGTLRGIPGGRYIALGGALLIVGLIVARVIYGARLREEAEQRARAGRKARTYADPWAEAERAAADGRFTDAAHALHAAVLESLSRRERVRLHPSKTDGDYARELRRAQSGAYGPFREFGRLYDRLIYGYGACDGPGYAALLERATPLLSRDKAA